MSVEFPEEKYGTGDTYTPAKTPTMVKWVMKTGVVKDEKQANIVLVGIAIVFFMLTIYIFIGTGESKNSTENRQQNNIIYWEDLPEDVRANLPQDEIDADVYPSKYE